MSETTNSSAEMQLLKIERNDPSIMTLLSGAPIYKKRGEIKAVIANGGEEVITTLADGTTETKNVANPGDVIVTNPSGEQYVVKADIFAKRYEQKIDESGLVDGVYQAKGYCRAIDNPYGRSISMSASWGTQIGATDCKIAANYDPEHKF